MLSSEPSGAKNPRKRNSLKRDPVLRRKSEQRSGVLATIAMLVATVVIGWPSVQAAEHTEHSARIRAIVDPAIGPLMSRHDLPGMAVGVIVDGQPHVFTYGVASREDNQPVTKATLFEIGSVSKVFTATLAAHAQAIGKLSFDDHPGKFLPELRDTPIDRVTLLHLGTYTAGGLPLQVPDEVSGEAATLAFFRDWKPLAAPGAQRLYSNPSPGLLGLVTASALGGDFARLMQSSVFEPLGMADSYIRVPEHQIQHYAWGYRNERAVRVNPGSLDAEAYGVKTTVSDLLRFLQANMDPAALEAPMRDAIQATQVGHFRVGPMIQGLGWERYPYPVSREWLLGGNAREMLFESQPVHRMPAQPDSAPSWFNKTGSTGGFASYVAFVPTRKLGIVLLANRSYPIPDRIDTAWVILEQLASLSDSP